MFDKQYIQQPKAPDQHVTITEKRAPTDESVRLLSEFETAAKNKILDSIRVSDNGFECIIHRQYDLANDLEMFCAIFSLNGKKMMARFNQDKIDSSFEKIGIGLRDAVAKEIANEIAGAFKNLNNTGFKS
jgi:hypothetical protein